MIDLTLGPIEDIYIRENFQKLLEEFSKNPFLMGSFRPYTATVKKTDTAFKIMHGLPFIPSDIFVSYISNDATVVPVFSETSLTTMTFNVSKACEFRIIAGRTK